MKAHDANTRWIFTMLMALTALRLWAATRFELIGDEAYYWQWARHLDWCYYSKGPLVAWTIRLGTWLFGDTVLGIRFFSICIGTLTLGLLYRLTRLLFSPRVALWTLILAACTPLFVIGSLLMTIDPLFIFFWMLSISIFWHAKDTERTGPWLLTGITVGLGMLAKYTNVALLPSFTLFLWWVAPYRHHLRRRTYWTMCLSAVVCLLPVLLWNAQHNWITLTHLQERGALDRSWQVSASSFMEFLGGQLAAYYPFFAIGILFSLVHGGLRRRAPQAARYLISLSLPLLAVYAILAVNDPGEANWTAAAIMTALPLLAATWISLSRTYRSARVIAWVALTPAVLLACLILTAVVTPLPGIESLLYRVRGWRDLAGQVDTATRAPHTAFVIADHYQTASLLAFYMEGHPDTYIVERPRIQNQYSFWPSYTGRKGEDAVYLSRHASLPPELQRQFTRVDPPRKIMSHWKARPVRPFYLFRCHDYRGNG